MAVLVQIGPYVDAWDNEGAGTPARTTMSGWSHTTETDPQAAVQWIASTGASRAAVSQMSSQQASC